MENTTPCQAIVHHRTALLIQSCRNIKALATLEKSKKGTMLITSSSILSQKKKNPNIYYFCVQDFLCFSEE